MPSNGYLPAYVLAPIAGGHLRKDAAARWNAMNVYRRAHGRATIVPSGSLSSYRTYGQQVFLRRQWCARGACRNAAIPGTSNHGWGLAVDTGNAPGVNHDGPRYGWAKRWSDASWEPWHFRVNFAVPFSAHVPYYRRVLRLGSHGHAVRTLQVLLRHHGALPRRARAGNHFGPRTRRAVRRFQRRHHMRADGVVGPATWRALRR